MKLSVIIPAAGSSVRFNEGAEFGDRSKLDEDLGGRPVLQRTVELFCKRTDVDQIIVAGPHDGYDQFALRHADKLGLLGVTLCRGGQNHRWETVRAALEHVEADATHIAVHDAARPATPIELIDRLLEAAQKHDAVLPAIEVEDTLKRVAAQAEKDADIDPLDRILGGAGKSNIDTRRVEQTIDRRNLVRVQTPQIFSAPLLRRTYDQGDPSSTDDAGLVERLGEHVLVIEGDPRNLKITRPADLHMARLILKAGGPQQRPAHKRF